MPRSRKSTKSSSPTLKKRKVKGPCISEQNDDNKNKLFKKFKSDDVDDLIEEEKPNENSKKTKLSTKSSAPTRKSKVKDPPSLSEQNDDDKNKLFKKFKSDDVDDLIEEEKPNENSKKTKLSTKSSAPTKKSKIKDPPSLSEQNDDDKNKLFKKFKSDDVDDLIEEEKPNENSKKTKLSTKSSAPTRKSKVKDPPSLSEQNDDDKNKLFKKFKSDDVDDLIEEEKPNENSKKTKLSTKSSAPTRKSKVKDPPSLSEQNDDDKNKLFKKFKSDDVDDLIEEEKPNENSKKTKLSLQTKFRSRSIVPHYLFPSLNAHHTLDPFDIYNDIKKSKDSFCTSLSWPLYISSIKKPEAIDLCHKRVKANQEYHINLKRCYSRYNTSKNKKEYKKAKKKGIYPYIVIKFAELLEQHPDSYFNSKYDWYYTGGNLCTIEGDNDEKDSYVYHVTGPKLDNLVLSKITNTNLDEIKFERLASIKSNCLQKESSEIFEIQSVKKSNSKFDCIIRQKNFISRYDYTIENNSNENNVINRYYSISNDNNVPFISFTTNPDHNSYLITSDLNKIVNLWDTEKSTLNPIQILYKSSSNNPKIIDKNWNTIRYFKPNTFIFTDLNDFTILDQRISFDEQQQIKLYTLKKSCDPCEEISIVNSSKLNDNYIYFGTTHKLFTIDIRYLNLNKNRQCIVSEWKHQMYLPPIFLDTLSTCNTNEIILTGTAHYEDIRLFEHHQTITSTSSSKNLNNHYNSSLPFMPEINYDVYKNLYLNGICLNTTNIIEKRIKCCNTGIKFLNNHYRKFILQSNSLGDLYIQQLSIDNDKISIDKNFIKQQWKYYENDLLNKNQKLPLNVTCIEDFSSFKKVFRCKRLDQQQQQQYHQQSSIQKNLSQTQQLQNNEQDDEEEEEILEKPKRLQKWQRSFNELKKFKDALAKDLLLLWDDIDFDDDTNQQQQQQIIQLKDDDINLKKLSKIVENKTSATEKISDWFDKTETINDATILDDGDEKMTIISIDKKLNLSKLTDTSFDLYENEDEINQSIQNFGKKKTKSNKRKIGF